MCGLAFVRKFDSRDANKVIRRIFFNQKDRGKEGFGFYSFRHCSLQKARYEHEIFRLLKKYRSSEFLFHHRKPTSTHNTPTQSHPFFIDSDDYEHYYYVIFNGSIENDRELLEKHLSKKLHYSTLENPDYKSHKDASPYFNDGEAFAHEIVMCVEGKKKFMETEGGSAFILAQVNKDTNSPSAIFFGRNSARPLSITRTHNALWISSVGKKEYSKNIDTNCLYRMDYKSGKIESLYHLLFPLGVGTKDDLGLKIVPKDRVQNVYAQDDFVPGYGYCSLDDSAENSVPYHKKSSPQLNGAHESLLAMKENAFIEWRHSKGDEKNRLQNEIDEISQEIEFLESEINRRIKGPDRSLNHFRRKKGL